MYVFCQGFIFQLAHRLVIGLNSMSEFDCAPHNHPGVNARNMEFRRVRSILYILLFGFNGIAS